MGKRFTDTNLNRQPWFRKLSPKIKCAVRFLFDECDNAGVWIIDMESMSFFIGETVEKEELFLKVNSDKVDRIETFGKDKIFIPGFVSFQYGKLSEDCRPHKPIIQLLKKYNLYERVLVGYSKGINTLEDNTIQDNTIIETVFIKKAEEKIEGEITEMEIGKTIEFIKITANVLLTNQEVKNFYKAFLIHAVDTTTLSKGNHKQHYRNWLKKQKLKGNSATVKNIAAPALPNGNDVAKKYA